MKKLIAVISAVIIITIISVILYFSPQQTQPTQPIKTRTIDLTHSYGTVNGEYLILNGGHTVYYNIVMTVEIYKNVYSNDSIIATRTFRFSQTEALTDISEYGIIFPNIGEGLNAHITLLTAETHS